MTITKEEAEEIDIVKYINNQKKKKERENMFTNAIKETKRKINLTINPTVYRTFSEIAEKRLQPKSWIIESMMKNYITSNK